MSMAQAVLYGGTVLEGDKKAQGIWKKLSDWELKERKLSSTSEKIVHCIQKDRQKYL